MKVLGIDEAGKGAVVGFLVVSGALFKKKDVKKLQDIDVKDSKLLSRKKRESLFEKIKSISQDYKVIEVSPKEIDQRFSVNTNLNQLEAAKFAELINDLKPDLAIIDCPSPNIKRFENYLKKLLNHECKLKCEHKADENHFEVGAASILAKVIRDNGIKKIEEKINEKIGAGYPSDPTTLKFVEKALKNKNWLNDYVRRSWLTFQRIKAKKEQSKIMEFKNDK